MKHSKSKIIAFLILLIIFATPHIIFAQSVFGNFVKCGNDPVANPCGFNDLVILVKDVITGLIEIATLITTGVLAFTGFKLITAGGDEGELKKAKERFKKTIIGYLWILVAWTLVYTIMTVLLKEGNYTNLLG